VIFQSVLVFWFKIFEGVISFVKNLTFGRKAAELNLGAGIVRLLFYFDFSLALGGLNAILEWDFSHFDSPVLTINQLGARTNYVSHFFVLLILLVFDVNFIIFIAEFSLNLIEWY